MAMAIAAYFDLKAKQYDVINAFINAQRDLESALVTCHLLDGFKREGMVVEL
jgi:sRNA-binding regulator protein Hfq